MSLIYAALANLQPLADMLERSRLGAGRSCPDAGPGENQHQPAVTEPMPVTGTSSTPAAPSTLMRSILASSFWDEP